MDPLPPGALDLETLLHAASTVFGALGRGILCLDRELRIVHASEELDHLLGAGAVAGLVGRRLEVVLGAELVGPAAPWRLALEAGERREGWAATLASPKGPRRVSLSAAPLPPDPTGGCDPRVAYVVIVRPAEEAATGDDGAPTVFAGLVARSASMLQIFRLIADLEPSEAAVLLSGERGTGKERLARALHDRSPRRQGPFVVVDCGALVPGKLEGEVLARVEDAGRGTLFLDEVGDLPPPAQAALAAALQEASPEGEGGGPGRGPRLVASTREDLRRAVEGGRFRDDLYYRLRVVTIEVPPLRERRADIEPLAAHLLRRVSLRHGRALWLAPDAVAALRRHSWPGNVRELENALEHAVAVCRGQTLHAEDLPADVAAAARDPAVVDAVPPAGAPAGPEASSRERERERLRGLLEVHCWRRDETAKALGTSRTTLWRRMRELDLLR